MRRALRAGPPRSPTAQPITFLAPRRGWISNKNLAQNLRDGAAQLDNIFPTANGARVRRGSDRYATIGAGAAVGSIISYTAGSVLKLFAATAAAIYDITTPADPDVSPAAAQSGLSGGDWSWTQTTNTGGTYLTGVNGTDIRQYDGAAWSTPVFTGGSAPYRAVLTAKNRIWLLKENSTDVYYGATDAIAGALSLFPVGQELSLGGTLLFAVTWSVEAGDGLQELVVFVSTEGECVAYQGSDPSSADTWSKKGTYRVGRPSGKNGYFKSGGDVAIATDIGLVPLSQAFVMDPAALAARAISFNIEPDWNAEFAARSSAAPWSVQLWPSEQMAVIATPNTGSQAKQCFVVNVRTGGWARYTGWSTMCLGLFRDRLFFGTDVGEIVEAEVGGSDQGTAYEAVWVPTFDDGGSPGRLKRGSASRLMMRTNRTSGVQLSYQSDNVITLPTSPSAPLVPGGANTWGTGLWGTAVWSSTTLTPEGAWQSTPGHGSQFSVAAQIPIGFETEPEMELVQIDVQLQTAGVAVANS